MKKILKIALIVIAIAAVLYFVYIFLMMPNEKNSPESLARDYFENINASDLCETHFNPDTEVFCSDFQDLFVDQSVVVENTEVSGQYVIVTISIGENESDFSVTFISEDVPGIKGFFNGKTYLIDMIN